MGRALGTAYMGFNTDEKHYTFDSFNSVGEAEHAKGAVEGDTWTWTLSDKMGGQAMKGRYTITVASPTAYNFKFEVAPEGGDLGADDGATPWPAQPDLKHPGRE